MRYISLLLPIDSEKHVEYSTENTEPHFYNENLYDKYMILNKLRNRMVVQKNYRDIVRLSHPFEYLNVYVNCSFIPGVKPMKITNAFMKMWEFLLWLKNKSLFDFKKPVDMFDIAGAPGMFVIATDNFIKKYYPNSSLNWYSCSLEGGTALTDSYGLYKNNLDRYKSCDVSNETDLKNCLKWVNRKFNLVTGDIGIFHEDVYEKLQEEDQLNIQWGQMVLALNLCENGGILFLKMYSLVTEETVYLLDTLTGYFENVYIVKPYTSRVLNTESYIICINKNKKDVSNVPFVRPYIKNYTSDNMDLIKSFEYSRLDIKFRMNNLINHLLSSQPNLRMEEAKENAIYKVYFEEFKDIYDTITQITKDENQQKETSKEKPNKAIEQKKQKKQNTDIIIKNKTLLLTD